MEFPEQIQKRIDEGMDCGIGPGWMDLIVELDKRMAEIAPDYVIDQVKEKFGTLRYYVSGLPDGVNLEDLNDLLNEYYKKSGEICDRCGEPGVRCQPDGGFYIATRCEEHGYVKES